MMCNFPPWSFAARPVVCINYSLGEQEEFSQYLEFPIVVKSMPETASETCLVCTCDCSLISGQYGGACATQCLQPFCVELGMIPLQATVNIGHVDISVSEDGTLRNTAFKGQIRRAFEQFLWYARAMKKARSNQNDPFPVMNKGALLEEEKRANQ